MRNIEIRPEPTSLIRKLKARMQRSFDYYILCRTDITTYMRKQGARIGSGCSIMCGVEGFSTEPWLIDIGNKVTLTVGVRLITHDGSSRLFRQFVPGSSIYGNLFGTIQIYDNCFIGVDSIILPNIRIGPNSIVGAGSVVTHNVSSNVVVAGVPARQICTLDEYINVYKSKMVHFEASNRAELRRALTTQLWGEER